MKTITEILMEMINKLTKRVEILEKITDIQYDIAKKYIRIIKILAIANMIEIIAINLILWR